MHGSQAALSGSRLWTCIQNKNPVFARWFIQQHWIKANRVRARRVPETNWLIDGIDLHFCGSWYSTDNIYNWKGCLFVIEFA